jgi:ATP-binding cassette subfamily C protein
VGSAKRLGIARALYSKPQLLILDEATSSLDAGTEKAVAETIHNLAHKVTLIVIAHRIATVQELDQVIYLDNGQIIAKGTFEEVRSVVPQFERQAKLLGL